MRVLFLTHNYPRYAGDPVGSFVLRLAVSLREEGIESHVVAPAAPDVPPTDVIEGVPVTRFRYAPRRLETLAYTGTMGAQVRQFWKARLAMVGFLGAGYRAAMRVNGEFAADVVHAHWWFPGGLVARAVRARTGTPYVVTMHGSDVRLASSAPGAATLYRTVSRRSAAMTTVSSWLAGQAERLDPAVRAVVAPMPVVADLFHAGGHRDASRLLFIGKLTEQKGLHHLLRAMARMRARPRLDVVGAGRVEDSGVRALARELGVDDRVTWKPLLSQAELAACYREAAIHVIPAIDEGLGLTAVESLLSETPVVAFDSGGVTDVVRPGQTGVLVPPGDVEALANALDRLLGDADERARLGTEGRAFALREFGPAAVAARYAAILRAAQRGKGAGR
jgi:glycosyltransferase involved in cell wall biosynthesis